jgi:tetratricopeptide (TPR) repeat protein
MSAIQRSSGSKALALVAALAIVGALAAFSLNRVTVFLCKQSDGHLKAPNCTLAIKLNRTDSELLFHSGLASIELGEVEPSLEYFSRAILMDPTRSDFYVQRSRGYTKRRQFDRALVDLSTANKISPESASPYFYLGELREATLQLSEARFAYELALKKSPENLNVRINLARVTARLGDIDEGITALTRVIETNPRSGYAYATRGEIWRDQNNWERMLPDLATAINLGYLPALGIRAEYFRQRGEFHNSIRDYTKLIKQSRDKSTAYYQRAEVRRDAGEYINALNDYTIVLRLGKDHLKDAHHGRLQSLRGLEKYDAVIVESTAILQQDSSDWVALVERGIAFRRLGKPTHSIRDLTAALSVMPEFWPIFYQRALTYLGGDEKDSLSRAIADTEAWVRLKPSNVQARLFRARLFALDKQLDPAIADFSFVLDRDPKNTEALVGRGRVFKRIHRDTEALADLTSAIQLGVRDIEVFYWRGVIYQKLDLLDLSLADFNAALRLQPDDYESLSMRALTLVRLDRHKEARKDFTELIRRNPNDSSNFTGRAMAAHQSGEHEVALADLSQGIRVDPLEPMNWLYQAEALTTLGENDAAFSSVEKAIGLDPPDQLLAQALYLRGRLRQAAGDIKSARQDYRAALLIYEPPSTASTYRLRGLILAASGQRAAAERDLQQAVRRDRKSVLFLKTLGEFYVETGRYFDALSTYEKALLVDPAHVESLAGKAAALNLLGELDSSIQVASEALEIDSNNEIVKSILKISLQARQSKRYLAGDFGGAVVDLTRVLAIDPNDMEARAFRGDVWRSLGNYRRATDDLTAAIQADPENPELFFSRGLVRALDDQLDGAINDYQSGLRLKPDEKRKLDFLNFLKEKKARQTELNNNNSRPNESSTRRVALVIGNSNYKYFQKLKNPRSDAQLISQVFRSSGFDEVYVKYDVTRDELQRVLRDFAIRANSSSWAVIYYAGHGVEVDGTNFIVPVDAPASDVDSFLEKAVNMFEFNRSAGGASELQFLVFDACRENPFDKSIGRDIKIQDFRSSPSTPTIITKRSALKSVGLARVEPDPGMLVTFSAKSGQRALDGRGNFSPFATAFAKRVREKPGIELRRLVAIVSEDVLEITNQRQQPFTYGSPNPRRDFYFANQ